MRREIRFAGFGGQGIVLSGFIVGKAATIFDKKHAVLTQNYGPEARGGACSADIVISDSGIEYPKLTAPDILVIMSQEAYHTYGNNLGKNSMLIIDKDLVNIEPKVKKNKVYAIPSTRFAEELGKKIVANIVMLGFFTAVSKVVSFESMEKAILSSVPKGTEELNMKAFNQGYEYGKKLVG